MSSIKDQLRSTIERLDEDEARQLLELAHAVQRGRDKTRLWQRLAGHPSFSLPVGGFRPFKEVVPAEVQGIPASELLIKDRR